ncbi:MAG: toll/interleukin-1 receptor domain-containing protein, partial [Bacteroidales bacterium]|nr:toll/interleukin-1 receptor domain-containing protein [Bacteroidales bacterium]
MDNKNYTYDYFISYRRKCGGALSARLVQSILCKYGKKVFLDVDDIEPGEEFKPQISDAIDNSKDFILILNEESWREKENLDVYYKEIIKISQQSGKIFPIEFAQGVLSNMPDGKGCVLHNQLQRDIKGIHKISYNNEPLPNFENNLCNAFKIQYIADTQSDVKQFSMSIPLVELINRDQMVKKLSDEIVKHRLLNLVGIGGSGKTSLTYLMARTYGRQFNNIAHVAVNGNIKEDFVDSIDNTLEICQKEDTINKKYDKIFAELKKNYSVGNNLLILDINEIPDKNALNDFVNELGELPNSWIFLILSREKIGEYEYLNINDDAIFLKDLFLKKTENRYKDFEDFDKLWDVVYYNPLLTEQLGIYLRNLPKTKTLEEIEAILYGEKFRGRQRVGINTQKRGEKDDKTIIYFLQNLIHYQDFTPDEQELLRHFVLWKSEYIQYDIIDDLINFDSDEDLDNALSNLSERSIFSVEKDDKSQLSYKLHGLLADSLREQIDVTKQNYKTYFFNILRICTYNFREFLPYADCIGNSLCEYEIMPIVDFLDMMAHKFYDTWKTNYAEKLLEKKVDISNKRLKIEPENIDWLLSLASTYNNLANLQQDRLNDYESAEENYNNAIETKGRIIKISATPKYLNSLATGYNNLANLQDDHLNDPESAETNYKKAIEIREKITESSDDPEYLNGLASSYYNLAMLQQFSLNDYDSAEIHYDKAINIGEVIRKVSDNPKYLNPLSKAYNNLASLQKSQERYDSAIEN